MTNRTKTILQGVIIGEVFFVGLVLFAVLTSDYNVSSTPSFMWFPILVLPIIFGLVWFVDQKWDIGLRTPVNKPLMPIIGFAIFSMIATRAVLILEGAFHGVVREFYMAPDGLGPYAALFYWIGITIAMSTLSESGYRGIMQSKLMSVLGLWPAIAIVTFMNLISHRFDGLLERTVGLITILTAWGYLRHMSGSLMVTIITHILTIFAWDLFVGFMSEPGGGWDLGVMTGAELGITAAIGVVTFGIAVYFAKMMKAQ